MEKYVSYRVLRKVNDNCYFAHSLFSISLMLLTIATLTNIFQFLIWNILKQTMGNQGFYMKVKDRDSKTANLWRCVKKTCKARYKTDLEDTMILGGRFDYDHAEEEDRTIERQAL